MNGSPVGRVWEGTWLSIFVLGVCIVALVLALGFVPATTRYFPVLVSAGCICAAVVDIARRALRARHLRRAGQTAADLEPVTPAAEAPVRDTLGYAAWFFGYLGATWVVSFVAASAAFVALFLKIEAGSRWWVAALSGAAVAALLVLAADTFALRWPPSLFDPLGSL